MERRRRLFGAGSTAIGVSEITGSGAFSSVTADRDVDLLITADPDGLLGLDDRTPPDVREETGRVGFDHSQGQAVDGPGVNHTGVTLADAFVIRSASDRELNGWASLGEPNGNSVAPRDRALRAVEPSSKIGV